MLLLRVRHNYAGLKCRDVYGKTLNFILFFTGPCWKNKEKVTYGYLRVTNLSVLIKKLTLIWNEPEKSRNLSENPLMEKHGRSQHCMQLIPVPKPTWSKLDPHLVINLPRLILVDLGEVPALLIRILRPLHGIRQSSHQFLFKILMNTVLRPQLWSPAV